MMCLDIPNDFGTTILFQSEMKMDDYDVCYQKWQWESFFAESIIFMKDDVNDMTDDELSEFVGSSPIVEDKDNIVVRRGTDFVFVSFNFLDYEDLLFKE
jgi:hypothetical protein